MEKKHYILAGIGAGILLTLFFTFVVYQVKHGFKEARKEQAEQEWYAAQLDYHFSVIIEDIIDQNDHGYGYLRCKIKKKSLPISTAKEDSLREFVSNKSLKFIREPGESIRISRTHKIDRHIMLRVPSVQSYQNVDSMRIDSTSGYIYQFKNGALSDSTKIAYCIHTLAFIE